MSCRFQTFIPFVSADSRCDEEKKHATASSGDAKDDDSDVEIDLESVDDGDALNNSDDKSEGASTHAACKHTGKLARASVILSKGQKDKTAATVFKQKSGKRIKQQSSRPYPSLLDTQVRTGWTRTGSAEENRAARARRSRTSSWWRWRTSSRRRATCRCASASTWRSPST